jgi:hypothetical protein
MHYLREELGQLVQEDPRVFQWIEEGSLDGVWYWDLVDGDAEWMSPRFCEIFGYEYGEIPNTATWWQEHMFKEDLPATLANFEAHKEDPEVPYNQVVRYRHKTGRTVWVRCRGLIIRDDAGEAIRMLGVHTELTRHKVVEQELKRSVQELEQFAFIASHDLQEPLRMVSNFMDLGLESLLERGVVLTEDERECFEFVTDGAERMKRLIAGLLEYSRAGRELTRKPFAAADAVAEALGVLNGAVAERGADVRVGPLPTLFADFPSIARLFQNLIGNALKFRQDGVPMVISVDAEELDDAWQIGVRDTGQGFEQRYAEQIFVIFRRLGSKKSGEGLGLAVCRRIVERHGGTIWAESRPGQGSGFFFTIPKAPPVPK